MQLINLQKFCCICVGIQECIHVGVVYSAHLRCICRSFTKRAAAAPGRMACLAQTHKSIKVSFSHADHN